MSPTVSTFADRFQRASRRSDAVPVMTVAPSFAEPRLPSRLGGPAVQVSEVSVLFSVIVPSGAEDPKPATRPGTR